MKNTPAFQFYPNDILADPDMILWNMQALGAYWKLICYLWVSGGRCEFDIKVMTKLFNVRDPKRADKMWQRVREKFTVVDGVITHEGLLQQMQVQAESRLRRQAAARARWDNQPDKDANAYAKQCPSTSSPTPTATSTSSSIATSVRESKRPLGLDDHDLAEIVLLESELRKIWRSVIVGLDNILRSTASMVVGVSK